MTDDLIKNILNNSNNVRDLCNKLNVFADYTNTSCKIKNLINNINHYLRINKKFNEINFLQNKSGDIKLINPNLKKELIDEGYKIYTVSIIN